jgi:hypothetical protein
LPNRILRENLLKSRKYNAVQAAERDMYIRLMLLVDDWGRYNADPVIIAKEAYPTNENTTSKHTKPMLDALAKSGLILLYTDGKEEYLQITNWNQRTRATVSKFPSADQCQTHDSQTSDDGQTAAHVFVFVDEDVFDIRAKRFDEFWAAYPRKEDKKKSLTAWNNIKWGGKENAELLFKQIMAAVAAANAGKWAGKEMKYIPLATTWIHGERWNDAAASGVMPADAADGYRRFE